MLKQIKKLNNKGFSFVELIVVVAVLVVATGVTIGSVSTTYNARSYAAAKAIDGMISQSKANALSGRKNALYLEFDPDKKVYNCSLYYLDATGKPKVPAYESREVGNKNLEIVVNGVSLKPAEGEGSQYKVRLIYNMDTGGIKEFSYSTDFNTSKTEVLGKDAASASTAVIQFNSFTHHTITLYKSTGEHTLN